MNEHEAGRIAAAMNQARPDWPLRQLATLLKDERIANRPRRDVFVALAWVASEPNSASPYRVLEAGPWWRAAGVEGSANGRKTGPICVHCGEMQGQCEVRWVGDHKFEEPNAWMRRRITDPEQIAKAQEYARQAIGDAKEARQPEPKPETPSSPEVDRLRAAKVAGVLTDDELTREPEPTQPAGPETTAEPEHQPEEEPMTESSERAAAEVGL